LARHPLFDRQERVTGYELVCRSASGAAVAPAAGAITTVFGDIGLERLVGEHPAYMTVSRELLAQAPGLGLPPQRVVLQLPQHEGVDGPLLTILRELRDHGFRVGVGVWALGPGAEPALEVASVLMVRFGFNRFDVNQVIARRAELQSRRLTLIAGGVETRGEYDQCLKLGFDAFQGPLFPRPADVAPQRTPTFRLSALSTVAEACSFEELERLITQDAGLSHRFLRLSNSAFFAARAQAGSVHDALLRLGSEAVRRWMLLLLLSGLNDTGSPGARHQLGVGLQRARICELLARERPGACPTRAFSVGVLSVLPGLLGRPMAEILDELPVDQRLHQALSEQQGPEGRLLAAIQAYEHSHREDDRAQPPDLTDIGRIYAHALVWADDIAAQIDSAD
jgi:EAL and modified HD-GYP domain-containing signal transduction protein